MSDGATKIENKAQVSISPIPQRKETATSSQSAFQSVSTPPASSAKSPELKTYFDGLRGVTHADALSYGQRLEAFRVIIQKIVLSPVNPYSKIEKDLRSEMIESVAEVLADSPHPLPRLLSRAG